MTFTVSQSTAGLHHRGLPWPLRLCAVLFVASFIYFNARSCLDAKVELLATLSSREKMVQTLSLLKDAETGVRGFLLTKEDRFLEPYVNSIPEIARCLAVLDQLAKRDSAYVTGVATIQISIRRTMALLSRLTMHQPATASGGDVIASLEEGKRTMDMLRGEILRLLMQADVRLQQQEHTSKIAMLRAALGLGVAILGGVLLVLAGFRGARREAEQARRTSEQLTRDVSGRAQAERALPDQTRLLLSVLESMEDGVIVLDRERRLAIINAAATRVLPWTVGESSPQECSERTAPPALDGRAALISERGPLARAIRGEALDGFALSLRIPTGQLRSYSVTTRPIASEGSTCAAVCVFRDTTNLRRAEQGLLESERRYRALSLRDELTSLHNRRGFMEVAEHQMKVAVRYRQRCAVFFADLNGMKKINDELGHEMGDHALRGAARLLTAVFRSSDVVSRLGGDEFAIFAGECNENGVAAACARIDRAIIELNASAGIAYQLSISMGAAVWNPDSGLDLLGLIQVADSKMYELKRARGTTVRPGSIA